MPKKTYTLSEVQARMDALGVRDIKLTGLKRPSAPAAYLLTFSPGAVEAQAGRG